MSNVKKTFIGSAVCRELESEAPAAEEMLDRVVCSSDQLSNTILLYFSSISSACRFVLVGLIIIIIIIIITRTMFGVARWRSGKVSDL